MLEKVVGAWETFTAQALAVTRDLLVHVGVAEAHAVARLMHSVVVRGVALRDDSALQFRARVAAASVWHPVDSLQRCQQATCQPLPAAPELTPAARPPLHARKGGTRWLASGTSMRNIQGASPAAARACSHGEAERLTGST